LKKKKGRGVFTILNLGKKARDSEALLRKGKRKKWSSKEAADILHDQKRKGGERPNANLLSTKKKKKKKKESGKGKTDCPDFNYLDEKGKEIVLITC